MVEPTSTEPNLSLLPQISDETSGAPQPPKSLSSLKTRERLLALLFCFLLATVVFIPIFKNGFPGGVDSDRHYQWIAQFSAALKEPGVVYPRWLGSANNGLGSPVMLYYPPLSFYIAALFQSLTGDAQKALILSCYLALMLSGLTMYLLSREFFSHPISLFAAAIYMLAPYHLLDLYQGSAVPEFWSFVWLPLVLQTTQKVVARRNGKAILYLAVSYALLVLTHIPISFVLSLVLPVYILLLTRDFHSLWKFAVGIVLGLSLSALFLLPVAFERDFVRMNALLRLEYDNYFVLRQTRLALHTPLFSNDLDYYEPHASSMKPTKFRYLIKNEQAAFGIPILLLVGALLLAINRKSLSENLSRKRFVIAGLVVTTITLFMATKLSLTIWEFFPLLTFLQFPWRWLVITTLGSSLLITAALALSLSAKRQRAVHTGLIALAVILNLIISFFLVARAPFYDDDFDAALKRREAPEYRTKWWDNQLHEEETLPPYLVKTGETAVQVIDGEGSHQAYTLNAKTASTLAIRTLYFPGWAVRVDEKPGEISPSEEGYIQFNVEPGEHRLTVDFEDTRPRTAGKIISCISLLLVAGLAWFSYRKKP
jgi:uncharacterized membrane protein